MEFKLQIRFDNDGSKSHSTASPQADCPTIFGQNMISGTLELSRGSIADDSSFVELVLHGRLR
jgi:hypothetical protein